MDDKDWAEVWGKFDDFVDFEMGDEYQNEMVAKHGEGYYFMDAFEFWNKQKQLIQNLVDAKLKLSPGVQMVPKEKDMGVAEVKDAMSRLDKELDVYRNEVLEEVAVVIEQFKGSFGQDTVMSFAALVRGMKR